MPYTQTQRRRGHNRSLVVRREKKTIRQQRACELKKAGLSQAAIAKKLGVTPRTIRRDLKAFP